MVQINLQALCLSLLSCTFASPLATPDTSLEAVEAVHLSKRAQNRCELINTGYGIDYTVWMGGWGNHDSTSLSGCGTGFLDNLRGQCGSSVVDWGCDEIHENPHDTMTKFTLPGAWNDLRVNCVTEAFRRASPGGNQRLSCIILQGKVWR